MNLLIKTNDKCHDDTNQQINGGYIVNFEIIFKSLLIIHFTEHAILIVNYSSNAAHLHEHPCPPPLQPVALPPQSLLLGVNPKYSHRPLHCC